jgi:hypothetical protein
MNLSAEERTRIYFEEKALRENDGVSPLLMLAVAVGAMLAIAVLATVVAESGSKDVCIDDLRKAYSGLSPEEQDS